MSQILTTDQSYYAPIKHRIQFTSLDGSDVYFTCSPFENQYDIIVPYVDAERAAGETGSFNIVVTDHQGLVNKDHLDNARVTLQFGKSLASLKYYLVGFADITNVQRPQTKYLEYVLSGGSTKIQAAELMLLIRKASKIQEIDNPKAVPNPDYGIGNLVQESITDRKWRPDNVDDIEGITGWKVDGVSDTLNRINYPNIQEVLSTEWEFLEKMSATSGAPWDIVYDPITGEENLTMAYLSDKATGIVIKSGDLRNSNDPADRTAYIKGPFSIEFNSSSDAGIATKLYTTTIIDKQVISSQNSNQGSTNLTSRAIAQQVKILNDQRRITDLAFIMSKVGNPESPNDRVNGDLVMDSGDNKPTGQVLATFKIPLSDIKDKADTIFVNDIDVKIRFLGGENNIWIRMFQRSGLKGSPNTDIQNTVRWHHNNVFNTTQAYSAFAQGGDYDLKDSLAWIPVNTGPVYTYSIFSAIRRLQSRTNPSAAKRLRLKERVIDSSFITDPATVNRFLSLNLSRTSKARVSIPDFDVTVPNNFLFEPYQVVSFNDGLSNQFLDLFVQRARIVVSAMPGERSIGTYQQTISLTGSFNSLIGNCSCL
jgi:hypothetical protein